MDPDLPIGGHLAIDWQQMDDQIQMTASKESDLAMAARHVTVGANGAAQVKCSPMELCKTD